MKSKSGGNEAVKKRYLAEELKKFRRWGNYSEPEPPKHVTEARARIEKDEKIVARWEKAQQEKFQERRRQSKTAESEIRKEFAFGTPENTLKLLEQFKKKFPEFHAGP